MLIDDIDKDLLNLRWHKHTAGYMQTGGGNNKRYAHRIVLERKLGRKLIDGELCDHINRNKLDNRRSNLRLADKSINTVNRDKDPRNSTGYTGVYLKYPNKTYEFVIQRKGRKTFYSRRYKTALEAHLARAEKLKEYEY